MWTYNYSSELYHHGILGMRWGVRRYQNKDGSLTKAGRERYSDGDGQAKQDLKAADKARRVELKQQKNAEKAKQYQDKADATKKVINDLETNGINSKSFKDRYGVAADNETLFMLTHGYSRKQAVNQNIREYKNKAELYEKAAKDKAAGKLTDTQKMIIGGACVAVALTAAYGLKKYTDAKADIRLGLIKGGERISYDDFLKKYMGSETRLFKEISKDAVNNLSDIDVKLTSGQVFHRISTSDEQSFTYKVMNLFGGTEVTKDRLYLAFTEEDVTRYKAMLPKYWWNQWGFRNPTAHDVAYKALNTIKSPSPKKRFELFKQLIDEDSSVRDYVKQVYQALPRYEGDTRTPNPDSDLLARKCYAWLAGQLADTNNGVASAYIDKIKSLGYNAIIDDNDAGRLSDSPIIVLDPIKNVIRESVTVLSSKDIEEAANNLVEILDRK